jgi:hypothetical protein
VLGLKQKKFKANIVSHFLFISKGLSCTHALNFFEHVLTLSAWKAKKDDYEELA